MCGWYWSSSGREDYVDVAWLVRFDFGRVGGAGIDLFRYVRCVR